MNSENFSTRKTVSSRATILTSKLYGFLEVMNYSVNVMEVSILSATDYKSSIQTIGQLYPTNPIVQKTQKAIKIVVK